METPSAFDQDPTAKRLEFEVLSCSDREKGAYTGALSRQAGRFEIADGSSLFLDEVGDCRPDLQVKLLRVLQEEETFRRVGRHDDIQWTCG